MRPICPRTDFVLGPICPGTHFSGTHLSGTHLSGTHLFGNLIFYNTVLGINIILYYDKTLVMLNFSILPTLQEGALKSFVYRGKLDSLTVLLNMIYVLDIHNIRSIFLPKIHQFTTKLFT